MNGFGKGWIKSHLFLIESSMLEAKIRGLEGMCVNIHRIGKKIQRAKRIQCAGKGLRFEIIKVIDTVSLSFRNQLSKLIGRKQMRLHEIGLIFNSESPKEHSVTSITSIIRVHIFHMFVIHNIMKNKRNILLITMIKFIHQIFINRYM